MNHRGLVAFLALLALTPSLALSAPGDDSHMEWWRNARYGMFIHWGLYSVPGGEWKGEDYGKEEGGASAEWLMDRARIPSEEYSQLAKQFNPTGFNAAEWVATAKAAGMKYMVITSKHHDGFCLFETAQTDYDVMDATPFKRDIIKELSQECAKQGLKFGVYYSQFQDWHHRGNMKRGNNNPGTLTNDEYLALVQKQLDELLSNYGEMAVLWFDTGGADVEEANKQGARMRALQPNAVICSRLYSRKVPKEQKKYADFESLPDRTIANKRVMHDAETCMTMHLNWGYDQDDDNWKSTKDIIEQLALSSARGVNVLLNVGPSPEGTLCPEEIERLKEVGEWMQINGESIYGTEYAPVDFDFPWGAMTQKDQTVYLHVLEWKLDGITFNGIVGEPAKAWFLADPKREELPVKYDANGHITTIEVPAKAPDLRNTVIAVEYDSSVVADAEATGKYHWYTTRGKRHTEKEYSSPFANPEDDPTRPNALLIGDSISIGYTVEVRKQLAGKVDIFRIPGNGKDSAYGLINLNTWLGNRTWDVIHFNWGLWDLCYRNPKSKMQGRRDKVHGTITATPEEYRANMEMIVARLKETGATLIWCTTTPVPEGEPGRKVGDDVEYNRIAETIMKANGVLINDLHAHALLKYSEIRKSKGDVHFTETGYTHLAEKVALEISSVISK